MTLAAMASQAHTNNIIIQVNKPGGKIQPTMYGLFFEDINYAADGGLYAEMVKNRSFEFPQHFMGWKTFGNTVLRDDGPFGRNPHYVRLSYAGHPHKRTGLENEGFFGVSTKEGETYRFSVWARVPCGGGPACLRVELCDTKSMDAAQAHAAAQMVIDTGEWRKYQVLLKAGKTVGKGVLRIFLDSGQSVDLEHISLFPADTWMGHENGMRKDLAQSLAALKPGVFRFPGGCIVEGTDLATRYSWKNSVGQVENRPLNENRWQYSSKLRTFPDYYQSYGLGFYEFFRFAEEIGAEPLPVISCGLACQYQNKEGEAHAPLDSLQPYIQDALDLIEFANGDTVTRWGQLRAEMGHPEPFHLKYIGIGNEQWGKEYSERLAPFMEAVRKSCPGINIVGSSGPGPDGGKFDYLWQEMRRLGADLVDEHFYRPDTWFLSQGTRYDSYDRNGPKVFAGEYACHVRDKKRNHFRAALLEAAFMTGLERNADVVHMATYAPLLAHVEGWQWRPDLIWFDNLGYVRTTSYYVQQLYSLYKGTCVLPLTMDGRAVAGAEGQNGLFASAVYDGGSGCVIIKIANTSAVSQPLSISLAGMEKGKKPVNCRIIELSSPDPDAENTMENPDAITPEERKMPVEGTEINTEIAGNTFAVYSLEYRIPEKTGSR